MVIVDLIVHVGTDIWGWRTDYPPHPTPRSRDRSLSTVPGGVILRAEIGRWYKIFARIIDQLFLVPSLQTRFQHINHKSIIVKFCQWWSIFAACMAINAFCARSCFAGVFRWLCWIFLLPRGVDIKYNRYYYYYNHGMAACHCFVPPLVLPPHNTIEIRLICCSSL